MAMSVNDSDFTIESRQDESTGTYGNMIIKMGGKEDGQTPYFAVRNWTESGMSRLTSSRLKEQNSI